MAMELSGHGKKEARKTIPEPWTEAISGDWEPVGFRATPKRKNHMPTGKRRSKGHWQATARGGNLNALTASL
ncbi:unnamed protein product [Calypogeia fissa]